MRPWPVWNPCEISFDSAAFAPRRLISETNVCHPIDQAQRFGSRVAISKNDLSVQRRVAHPITVARQLELSGRPWLTRQG
jgi:hypothetical protein